jgi:hypothetical protein
MANNQQLWAKQPKILTKPKYLPKELPMDLQPEFVTYVDLRSRRDDYEKLENNAHEFKKDGKKALIFQTFTCLISNSMKNNRKEYKKQIAVLTLICESFNEIEKFPFPKLYSDRICKIASVLEEVKSWTVDIEETLKKENKLMLEELKNNIKEFNFSMYSETDYAETKSKTCIICYEQAEMVFHTDKNQMHLVYCKKCHEKDIKISACPICRVQKVPFAHIDTLKISQDMTMTCIPKKAVEKVILMETKVVLSDDDLFKKMEELFKKMEKKEALNKKKRAENKELLSEMKIIYDYFEEDRQNFIKNATRAAVLCCTKLAISINENCDVLSKIEKKEHENSIISAISYLESIKNEKLNGYGKDDIKSELVLMISAALCWKKNSDSNRKPRDVINSLCRKTMRIAKAISENFWGKNK